MRNKLALVTGGSRGIGKEIVKSLNLEGFNVYFTYKNDADNGRLIEEKSGYMSKGFRVDCSNEYEIKEFLSSLNEQEVPDVLINNVGVNNDELFINQSLDDFWDILKLNFGSALTFIKLLQPKMMARKSGHIINVTSVAAIKPKVGNSAYGVSKLAIERLSKTLALELARFNVRVNCISPAYVSTDLLENYLSKANKRDFLKSIPMRNVLDKQDVANMVITLVTGKVNTTGSVIYLGNGENIVS